MSFTAATSTCLQEDAAAVADAPRWQSCQTTRKESAVCVCVLVVAFVWNAKIMFFFIIPSIGCYCAYLAPFKSILTKITNH